VRDTDALPGDVDDVPGNLRAVALGEMSADRVPHAVALLVSFTLGVGVLMRSGASDVELAPHFEAAHALVESWNVQR
jgi:hypothetical protein